MDLEKWAGIITGVATAITVVVLTCQLWLQRKEQKSQALVRLFDEVVTPEFRRKLRLFEKPRRFGPPEVVSVRP
jgi:hypothetical protein